MTRKALAILILCLLASPFSVQASWLFDATDTVTVADNANLTLPASEWTVAGWIKLDGTSTHVRTPVSWGSGDQSFSIKIWTTIDYRVNSLKVFYTGWSADYEQWIMGGTPGDETDWVHITVCRDTSNLLRAYVYEDGVESALPEPPSLASWGACNASEDWTFGSTYFSGRIAEWAKWNRLLSAGERAALCSAGKPEEASGGAPVWMFDGFNDYDAQLGSLTATNHGTTIDQTTHPVDRGAAAPNPVTNVWPAGSEVINHQTQIWWTRTPPDSVFAQTFTVYLDKSNPPTTAIATDTSDLIVDSGALDDGATYYLRVDTKGTVGGATATGSVVTFTTEAAPTHLYYVGPAATGNGSGSNTSNLMAWANVSTTESDAVIRLIAPTTVICYEYESANPASYTVWVDRAYESRTVIEYGITRNFQDWRRIGRFVDGTYWGIGPLYVVSYSPARALNSGGLAMNGMMVNPASDKMGLDEQNDTGWMDGWIYDASLDVGDDLPYLLNTYPSSVLNCVSLAGTDPERSVRNYCYSMRSISIFTVLETPIANNVWFRPTYRAFTGNDVKYQWSDVIQARLPQINLACPYQLLASAGETRNISTEAFTSLERIVSRASMDLIDGWVTSRCQAWNNAEAYGGTWASENGKAYLACFDSSLGTIAAKKRLIVACIQRGIDVSGVYFQSANRKWWFDPDGGCYQGRYWPILFAGVMLDDPNLYNIGIATHQDVDNNWTLDDGMIFPETSQTFQAKADFLGSGLPFWDTEPWLVTASPAVIDNTGTVTMVKGSPTVTGLPGEIWGGATAGKQFITTQTISGAVRVLDEVRGYSTTARAYTIQSVNATNPPTLTLTANYQGENVSGAAFMIADGVYLGKFYKLGTIDYDEFDDSWDNEYWWDEKPATISAAYTWKWALSTSTYDLGDYMGIFTSSMIGMALCPIIMNENNGYPVVPLYNSPQFFGYFDGRVTALGTGNWGNYTDSWAKGLMQTQWSWPATEWGPPEITDPPTGPVPANAATSQKRGSRVLSWDAVENATSYDVWFGTDQYNMALIADGTVALTVTLPLLMESTTYYWRVDPIGAGGIPATGTVWSFTTRAAKFLMGG